MKKNISVIILLIILALILTACNTAHGTYKFESMSYNEGAAHFEYKVGEKLFGISFDESIFTLTLNKDGSYKITSNIPGEEMNEEGTWKKDGKKIIFDNEDAYSAKIEKKKLILEFNEEGATVVVVLKK